MKLFVFVQNRDLVIKLLALVLLAIGLAWFVNRRLGTESVEAVHTAFMDCAGKDADIYRVKECVSAQLSQRGSYRYSVDSSSHTLSIQTFYVTQKFPGVPGDLRVTCGLSPRPHCDP